jgi:hypothetical protein
MDLEFWKMHLLVDLPALEGSSAGQMLEASRLSAEFRRRLPGQADEPILGGLVCTLFYPTGWSAFLPAVSLISPATASVAHQPASPLTAPVPFCDLSLLAHRAATHTLSGTNLGMFYRLFDLLDDVRVIRCCIC